MMTLFIREMRYRDDDVGRVVAAASTTVAMVRKSIVCVCVCSEIVLSIM